MLQGDKSVRMEISQGDLQGFIDLELLLSALIFNQLPIKMLQAVFVKQVLKIPFLQT